MTDKVWVYNTYVQAYRRGLLQKLDSRLSVVNFVYIVVREYYEIKGSAKKFLKKKAKREFRFLWDLVREALESDVAKQYLIQER